MATNANNQAMSTSPSTMSRNYIQAISVLRMFAGALTWVSPKLSSRVFLLGGAALFVVLALKALADDQ